MLKPAPKLTKELCHIVWDRKTKDIYNLIRGLSPYPGAYTELVKDDKTLQLKIYAGEKLTPEQLGALLAGTGKPAEEGMAPGNILSDGKSWLAVTTADGAISLTDLQAAGKKRMNVRDFLAGFREPESWSLS